MGRMTDMRAVKTARRSARQARKGALKTEDRFSKELDVQVDALARELQPVSFPMAPAAMGAMQMILELRRGITERIAGLNAGEGVLPFSDAEATEAMCGVLRATANGDAIRAGLRIGVWIYSMEMLGGLGEDDPMVFQLTQMLGVEGAPEVKLVALGPAEHPGERLADPDHFYCLLTVGALIEATAKLPGTSVASSPEMIDLWRVCLTEGWAVAQFAPPPWYAPTTEQFDLKVS